MGRTWSGPPTWGTDILIVHVDADACRRYGASDTDELCDVVKGWLGPAARQRKVVVVIPAPATDAWLLAAHRPVDPGVEREASPADRLARERLIARDGKGRPLKNVARYEELAGALPERIPGLRRVLKELDRFVGKVERWVADQA